MTKPKKSSFIFSVVYTIVIIIMLVLVIEMQNRLSELKQNKETLAIEMNQAADTLDEVRLRLNTPLSDEYIERVAREKLGYRMPNEIIFYNDLTD